MVGERLTWSVDGSGDGTYGSITIDAAGHVRPAHIKDRVRALGPTVRRDLAVPTANKTGWDWVI